MPAPEITLRLLSGAEAAGSGEDIAALRAEVCGAPPHRDSTGQHGDSTGQHGAGRDGAAQHGADGGFGRRFGRQRRQPGFVLAEARHGGYLVGYAFGVPLRPATSWWRDLTAPLPEELTAEHPGRTFALAEPHGTDAPAATVCTDGQTEAISAVTLVETLGASR